jgi:hypothetical protein
LQELYRSAYQRIEYEPEYSLIKRVLTVNPHNHSWPEHRLEWQEYASLVRNYQPENIFVDARRFDFILPKEMRDWINSNVIAVFNDIKLKKWAILVPPHFLHQVSIEEAIDTNPANVFATEYFESEQEAMDWIKNGKY